MLDTIGTSEGSDETTHEDESRSTTCTAHIQLVSCKISVTTTHHDAQPKACTEAPYCIAVNCLVNRSCRYFRCPSPVADHTDGRFDAAAPVVLLSFIDYPLRN